MPPFFFWDLVSSLLYLFWILFQAYCPSILYLVVLGFYLSFFSTKFVSHLILSSFLCLWALFHRLQDCSSYLRCLSPSEWGWFWGLFRLPGMRDWSLSTDGGAGSCPSSGWVMSNGASTGDCGLRRTLGGLSVDRWGCVPALLVVWPEAFQH